MRQEWALASPALDLRELTPRLSQFPVQLLAASWSGERPRPSRRGARACPRAAGTRRPPAAARGRQRRTSKHRESRLLDERGPCAEIRHRARVLPERAPLGRPVVDREAGQAGSPSTRWPGARPARRRAPSSVTTGRGPPRSGGVGLLSRRIGTIVSPRTNPHERKRKGRPDRARGQAPGTLEEQPLRRTDVGFRCLDRGPGLARRDRDILLRSLT
jgi:hypothetical protein